MIYNIEYDFFKDYQHNNKFNNIFLKKKMQHMIE